MLADASLELIPPEEIEEEVRGLANQLGYH
jgi:hypothetical protein